MGLRDDQRARYARHLLLPELGEAGQERLLAGRVRFPHEADAGARAVALGYLERAGVRESAREPDEQALARGAEELVPLLDAAACARIAGRPELLEAARSLAGALAAVETIKRLAGLGGPGPQVSAGLLFAEDA
ncbi:MAG TPA: hypothetical protein VFZ61_23470 [Polyangiales bacterium]